MNKNKSLIATVKTTIYQRENMVDKIQFLFPREYDDISLNDFAATLKYIDQGNVPHSEILSKDEELYKDYICYTLPVDTSLTQFAGDLTVHITLTRTDMEKRTKYVLHTGEITITISPLQDWYKFVSDDSLEAIDQKMLELEAKIEATEKLAEIYDKKKADNIRKINDNELQLVSNGSLIGDAVTIVDSITEKEEIKVIEF